MYPFQMPLKDTFRESRRSTRVPLKLVIAVEGGAETLTCDGETIYVSLHGALISTAIALSRGTRISVHVYLTDKHAKASVVYVDPETSLRCGIELDHPRNIWGCPCRLMIGERTWTLDTGRNNPDASELIERVSLPFSANTRPSPEYFDRKLLFYSYCHSVGAHSLHDADNPRLTALIKHSR